MKSLIAVVVALVLLGGAWFYYSQYMAPAAVTNNTNTTINTNPTGQDYTPATTSDAGADAADGVSGAVSADINAGVTTGSVPTKATVTLTANGFSPKTVTIKKGGTITWTNTSTGQMWVASANHPTHTVYSGTTLQQHCASGSTDSFDECKAGNTYTFTFDKTGSWNYHNHTNASQFGTIVVVE